MHRVLFCFIVAFLVSACSQIRDTTAVPSIDLTNLQPLPTSADTEVELLRVAIAAVFSPQGSAESYAPLLDYLSAKLGRPIERVQRRTYAEVNDLLRTGDVDLAFVCTSSYLLGHEQFGLELLVVPQVNGKTTYSAEIIVATKSSISEVADLQGKVFAFTDPTSFSGRIYPAYLLQQMGVVPESFFSRFFFTYSHDKAIYAVAEGQADAASVDSLVLDFALKRDPALMQKIRVIHTSPAFGIPPVVVSPSIRPQLRAVLTEILLNMNLDSDGLIALQVLDYDGFITSSDDNYQSAKEIESAVNLSKNP
ncbi:MAG: phosphate/phosphite/phosphonate ABC transporter substrate-binding protein [Anaerolineae bacterium CG_4_9_14_3_um_filter_57_17]|nr:phosphate/phosphite/phosphonate ABC transporter substrate-binding protein [bacterium]NCT19987.1 phosphate/phosphite/phosphonate ABC transporter substrate-binding protein [bacterium]OIO84949.1 MAG: phosphonate ABC transporter substrate-binding protein [Anaerolineae bacterium CG2_30_57_67]PJB64083.1 MAG: phosphate/phosphite/phosphonate ABC transporter substrate-binding protein [Anaerolineae bacterium CG_4_9_14_3_um_filter_57_17]